MEAFLATGGLLPISLTNVLLSFLLANSFFGYFSAGVNY
jgi:hypothetical protein